MTNAFDQIPIDPPSQNNDVRRAWIRLRSGRHLDLINPSPADWNDTDLALRLSHTYRWDAVVCGLPQERHTYRADRPSTLFADNDLGSPIILRFAMSFPSGILGCCIFIPPWFNCHAI